MRLAIVGSRTFSDYGLLAKTIFDFLAPIDSTTHIISGGAKGADALGEKFAYRNNAKLTVYRAEWDKYGKSAGFLRNQTIVDDCDIVIAFWDGVSHGTADTINKAKRAKKPIFMVFI